MNKLTFFAWGDTHFGYNQRFAEDDLRYGIIEQINNLPGWPYPAQIGGVVEKPDFVVHCGDIIDGEQSLPTEEAYYDYFVARLASLHYEVLGNHDLAPPFLKQFIRKYGGKSYSFDLKGFHFISLAGEYDQYEVGHIPEAGLDFIKSDLSRIDKSTPVVIFTHTRIDRLKNGKVVLQLLRRRQVKLIISAHRHKPAISELGTITCIDIGHCRNHPIDPEYGRSFYVVRLTGKRITALPWRWDYKEWECGRGWANPEIAQQRFMLDNFLHISGKLRK